MAKVNIKDLTAAQSLATKLDAAIADLTAIAKADRTLADNVMSLNQTVKLNEQASSYFTEIAGGIEKLMPEMETVSTQLKNAIKSMEGFEELADKNFLGNV